MGIKSTTRLTRETAEAKYAEIAAEMAADEARRHALTVARLMSDAELEDSLECANDRRAEAQGSVGFDNYSIVPEDVLREDGPFRP